jgi:AAHS family 4-hydroxybenzoate transporter-like MFS transporter
MLMLAFGAIVTAIGMRFVPIAAAASTLPLIVILTLNGGFTNATQTTMYALATQVYPTRIRATGVGAALAVGRMGAILSSYAGAWSLDAGGPPAFFLVVAAAMSASLIALAAVVRHIAATVRRG